MLERNRNYRRMALSGAFLLLSSALALPALALDKSSYSMELLVRGVPAAEYFDRGKTYVEALEDEDYAIRLTNRTATRVAIALSVDGLNTIDAKTTSARDASRWILGPYQSITIDGWQTSGETARRFFFTTERRSYGAWLGKTDNLGVISAAVFREKHRPVTYAEPRRKSTRSRAGRDAAGPAPAPGRASGEKARESLEMPAEQESAGLSDDMAATGIGDEIRHQVRRIRFESEPKPAAVLNMRYEYRDQLVRLGVLPEPVARWEDPLDRRERARGFDDIGFAPDPFRSRR